MGDEDVAGMLVLSPVEVVVTVVTEPRTQYDWPTVRVGQAVPGFRAWNSAKERPHASARELQVSPLPALIAKLQVTVEP